YEQILSSYVEGVTLPYWDWSKDSVRPETSPLFTNKYMGGNGRSGDHVLVSGPFANWRVTYPETHYLTREFTPGPDSITPFWSTEALLTFISITDRYDDFHFTIEDGPHATVHIGIGGDMVQMYSPNEPFFFLHHAMVDKLWADWQKDSPSKMYQYNGVDKYENNREVKDTDILPKLPSNAQIVVNTLFDTEDESLCYRYEDSNVWGATKKALARRNNGLRKRNERRADLVGTVVDLIKSVLGIGSGAEANGGNSNAAARAQAQQAVLSDLGIPNADVGALPTEDQKLKEPIKNPQWWNEMNGLDPQQVEQVHQSGNEIIEEINNDPNYVAPAVVYHAALVQGRIADSPAGPVDQNSEESSQSQEEEETVEHEESSSTEYHSVPPTPAPPSKEDEHFATFTNYVTKNGVPSPVVVVVKY
ncbi:hypothetical protein EV182_002080, partial [Spiromyces aspiralis]